MSDVRKKSEPIERTTPDIVAQQIERLKEILRPRFGDERIGDETAVLNGPRGCTE